MLYYLTICCDEHENECRYQDNLWWLKNVTKCYFQKTHYFHNYHLAHQSSIFTCKPEVFEILFVCNICSVNSETSKMFQTVRNCDCSETSIHFFKLPFLMIDWSIKITHHPMVLTWTHSPTHKSCFYSLDRMVLFSHDWQHIEFHSLFLCKLWKAKIKRQFSG